MKRIKVLHLISSVSFLGAEQVIAELCRNNDTDKFIVYLGIISLTENVQVIFHNKINNDKIKIITFHCKRILDFSAVSEIRKFVHNQQVDILHTHGYKADFYGVLVKLTKDKPLLFATVHNWMIGTLREKIYKLIDKFILKSYCKIIVVSKVLEDELICSGFNKQQICYIPNGVDVDACRSSMCRDTARSMLSLDSDAFIIGCVASLTYEKAHEYLIEAVFSLVKEFPKLKVVLIGDGDRRTFLEKIAIEFNVSEYIFFTGYRSDIRKLYSAFDLFVLVSRTEGLPMALLEAMASGIPVIASAVGAIPDLIGNNERGLLIEPCNVDDIIKAVRFLITDFVKKDQLAFQAQTLIRDSYSSTHMTRSYEFLYEASFSITVPK